MVINAKINALDLAFLALTDTVITQFWHLQPREYCRRWCVWTRSVRARAPKRLKTAMRFCLLEMAMKPSIHDIATIWLPTQGWSKYNISRHAKVSVSEIHP